MHRRSFVKHAAYGALGSSALLHLAACAPEAADTPPAPAAMRPDATAMSVLGHVGVQLYTLQQQVQDDFDASLQAVRAIGYTEVEFAGHYGQTPAHIAEVLRNLGMTAPAVHVGYDLLEEDLDRWIAAAKEAGHTFIVCPWLAAEARTNLDDYRAHAERFNAWGRVCRDAGLRFAYHNHDFEFETFGGAETGYDVLLANTDPALVEMELDLFWIHKAGYDPVAYFDTHPGRFPLFHVKDALADGGMTSVGTGVIDFARIFAHAERAGLEHAFVEHDNPPDPMATITDSYGYLGTLTHDA